MRARVIGRRLGRSTVGPALISAATAALMAAAPAGAGTVTYTSLSAWQTAVGGDTVVENFTGGTLEGGFVTGISGSGTLAGDRLTGVAGVYHSASQFTTLTLAAPVTAIAFDVLDYGLDPVLLSPELVSIYLGTVGPLWDATIPTGSTFFGLVSDTPFSSITFADATYLVAPHVNTDISIDTIRIAGTRQPPPPPPSQVPLPVSGLLAAEAFAVATVFLRRKSGRTAG